MEYFPTLLKIIPSFHAALLLPVNYLALLAAQIGVMFATLRFTFLRSKYLVRRLGTNLTNHTDSEIAKRYNRYTPHGIHLLERSVLFAASGLDDFFDV